MKILQNPFEILDTVVTNDTLTSINLTLVKDLFSNSSDACGFLSYTKGEVIIKDGELSGDQDLSIEYRYSHVPLGFIIKGSITVLINGQGVKKLEVGDFVGLFEASDWIVNERTRRLGDWTLIAEDDVSIIFFNSETLSNERFRLYLSDLARNDKVPKPITELPLLDYVASHTTEVRLADCLIIVHTHVLTSSVSLFRHLAHLVGFGNVLILDKSYSTVRDSLVDLIKSGIEVIPQTIESAVPYEVSSQRGVDALWQRVLEMQKRNNFKKMLIIDDGGDLWLSLPWKDLEGLKIAGVEQTQRGITRIKDSNFKKPPIVSVASSGTKKIIESGFIGKAVVDKLQDLGVLDKIGIVGVLGTGSIGAAVKEHLENMDKEVHVYDKSIHDSFSDSEKVHQSTDSLLREVDLVIGTVGKDTLNGVFLDRVKGKKILASASSSDIEFKSLLKLAPTPEYIFDTIHVNVHDELNIDILNGGFPVNFDRKKEWESPVDIVLTRCLLYIGIMQAAKILNDGLNSDEIYTLDQKSQEKTLTRWLLDKEKAGEEVSSVYKDVTKVTSATFLEDSKKMETVWKD